MKKKKINVQWVLLRLLMSIFLYSATVKMLDFAKFSSELAKSPFLHGMAGFMSVAVPLVELAVAFMLSREKTRRVALYAYLYIMTAFLGYVYLMMEKAFYIPCACMGLFDSLGWGPHLVINSVIILLVITAILLDKTKQTIKTRHFEVAGVKINPEQL